MTAIRRNLLRIALAILLSPALAGAAEEGGGTPNLFAGDLGNIVWTLVIFVVVLYVLGKFAWPPILNGLQAREDFIRTELRQAREERQAAARQLQEYEEKLAAARAEATAIVEEGRRDAEVVKARIEEDARREAEKMIARARREIGIAKETAVKELYSVAGHLATDVASRIVRKELSPADHERLIAESIERLEAAPRN